MENNDPFFSFSYAVEGWFFPFLHSLFEILFMCVLVLTWLLVLDKIRKEESSPTWSVWHIPMLALIFSYAVLSLCLYAWISIRDAEDPVFGTSVTGVIVLFYLTTTAWTIILVYACVLAALCIPIIENRSYLRARFFFFISPCIIAIMSIVVGIFTGTLGPLRRTSLSLVYFLFLYNVYAAVLAWGYMPPNHEKYAGSNPSETTRLVFASST